MLLCFKDDKFDEKKVIINDKINNNIIEGMHFNKIVTCYR